MAVHYDISSLDSNKTILETLHDIQKYLKANPIYKVYYANGSYAIGQAQYSISLLGNNQGQIAEGDVVFFNNNFYAKISSVGTQTFSVFPATAIQGSGGAQIKTMSQLEFLNVLSLLYDDNAGAHINMSGRTEYTDGTETPNTLEILIPFVPKDNSIKFETSENFEQVKVGLNSKVISNPNFVINPNFEINQRGKSSYTGANIYTLDRWQLTGGTVEPLTKGIKHTSNAVWQGLRQFIENPQSLAGKTITVSAKVRVSAGDEFELTIYSQKQGSSRVEVATVETSSSSSVIISATGTIPSNITNDDTVYVMLFNRISSASFWCDWVKLEVGELATEFVSPLLAEELAKCQRYYKVFAYNNAYRVDGYLTGSGLNFYMPCYLGVAMRTAPTLDTINFTPQWRGRVASGGYCLATGNSYKTFGNAGITYTQNEASVALYDVLTESAGDTNNSMIAYEITKLALDAEIY